MYQAVFVSVVGVILVIKIVFLVASILFTLKYENQGNRRSSVISVATTTLSFDSLDQSDSSLGEHSDGSIGEHSRGTFGDHSRGTFGEHSRGIVGERCRGSFDDGNFGELRVDLTGQTDSSSGQHGNGNRGPNSCNSNHPKVLFFDAIMHTEPSYNPNAFYEDSFV